MRGKNETVNDAYQGDAEMDGIGSKTNIMEGAGSERRFALLIDGDNVSGDYAKLILDEASSLGMVTIRYVYGNWMDNSLKKWKAAISEYSLSPRQQLPNLAGKNATDSALIVDTMDIFFRENVDGFIIVSSDSDYTYLAKRLRQSGKPVIGMGSEQTHPSFKNSCTQFITLKKSNVACGGACTAELKDGSKNDSKDTGFPDKTEIKSAIDRLLDEYDGEGGKIIVSAIADKLRNRYPDFSPRNYNCRKMSKLLVDWGYNVVSENSNSYVVCPVDVPQPKHEVLVGQPLTDEQLKDEIHSILKKSGKTKKVDISIIKDVLVEKYPSFKIKDYGCKKMIDLLKKLGFELVSEDSNKYVLKN